MNHGAALIYTKTQFVGFRAGFVVQPVDFSEAAASKYMKYVEAALGQIGELREAHAQRKIVIADDEFVILAVAGYLQDFSDEPRVDFAGRPIQGFMGIVFRKKEFALCTFPDKSVFRQILEDHIFPHWADKVESNPEWAKKTQKCDYSYEIPTIPAEAEEASASAYVFSPQMAKAAVAHAIGLAAQGKHISLCTNQSSLNEERIRFEQYALLRGIEKRPQPVRATQGIRPETAAKPRPETPSRPALPVVTERKQPKVAAIMAVVAIVAIFVMLLSRFGLKKVVLSVLIAVAALILLVLVWKVLTIKSQKKARPNEADEIMAMLSQKEKTQASERQNAKGKTSKSDIYKW